MVLDMLLKVLSMFKMYIYPANRNVLPQNAESGAGPDESMPHTAQFLMVLLFKVPSGETNITMENHHV